MRPDRIVHPEFEEWLWREVGKSPEYGHQGAVMDLFMAVNEAMESQGVTQAELARRAELKPSYVSRIMNNPENITMRTAFRLCNALDLELGFDIRPKQQPQFAQKRVRKPAARRQPAHRAPRKQAAAM